MKKIVFLLSFVVIYINMNSQIPAYLYHFPDNAKTESDTFNLTINTDFQYNDYYKIDSFFVEVYKIINYKNARFNQIVHSSSISPVNCNVKIMSETKDAKGNVIQKLVLKNVSSPSFGFDMNYSVSDAVNYNSFILCPFDSIEYTNLDDSLTQYLVPTDKIQSKEDTIIKLAKSITQGCKSTGSMVDSIVKWLKKNIQYDFTFNHDEQDAISVIENKTGLCEGYSNLMVAMLRSKGVVARRMDGYMTDAPIEYTCEEQSYKKTVSEGAHSWVEVFYPDLNVWVFTEPQSMPNLVYANYMVFNNEAFSLVKNVIMYYTSKLSEGSCNVSISKTNSEKIYCTNLNAIATEQYSGNESFYSLMSTLTELNTKCVKPEPNPEPKPIESLLPEVYEDFTVYPNPASNKISVVLPQWAGNATIRLYNLMGEALNVVVSENNNLVELNTQSCPSGMYVVDISTADEHVSRIVKIIK